MFMKQGRPILYVKYSTQVISSVWPMNLSFDLDRKNLIWCKLRGNFVEGVVIHKLYVTLTSRISSELELHNYVVPEIYDSKYLPRNYVHKRIWDGPTWVNQVDHLSWCFTCESRDHQVYVIALWKLKLCECVLAWALQSGASDFGLDLWPMTVKFHKAHDNTLTVVQSLLIRLSNHKGRISPPNLPKYTYMSPMVLVSAKFLCIWGK